jgi:hypothetical protein
MRRSSIIALSSLVMLWFFATAQASGTSNGFNLVGPQTTTDPSTGNTIRTTGGGSFDTTAGTVVASGSFTISDSSGAVISKGTWTATGFGSFQSFGGPRPGFQGGQLQMTVTLSFNGGGQETGQPMSVTCLINAPPGFTEGITVSTFTVINRGATLFHLNQ